MKARPGEVSYKEEKVRKTRRRCWETIRGKVKISSDERCGEAKYEGEALRGKV